MKRARRFVVPFVSGLVLALAAAPALPGPRFPTQVFYTLWGVPLGDFVVADLDGDGHVDLAGVRQGGGGTADTVPVVYGNGDGTFSPSTPFATGDEPQAIDHGDFNGDGVIDLVTANRGQTVDIRGDVCVLLGVGDGTFDPPSCFLAGEAPHFVAVADFNLDNDQDLIVSNSRSNDLSLILGNGDGTFDPETRLGPGLTPSEIAVQDFDSDGRPDLAVLDLFIDLVGIRAGNGDGTFGPETAYMVGDRPSGIAAGDLDEDGNLDLAISNTTSDDLSILLGNGDGTFLPQFRIDAGEAPASIQADDLNGDGYLDLAVPNTGSDDVSVFLGLGNGTFNEAQILPGQRQPNSLGAGDFDEDGTIDIAVGAIEHDVAVYLGAGGGLFPTANRLPIPVQAQSVGIGDFDLDGFPDFIASSGTAYLGNGDLTFGSPISTGPNTFFLVVGEFNGDGIPDVAGNCTGADTCVALGNGDGSFGPETPYPVGAQPEGSDIGDFNADGFQDLTVANAGSATVSILLGNGDGTFLPQVQYPVGAIPRKAAVTDLNNDGIQDLAVAIRGVPYSVSVLLGKGDGDFHPEVQFPTVLSRPSNAATGDFDGDGNQDVVIGSEGESRVAVLFGQGDGTLTGEIQLDTAGFGLTIALTAGDIDQDGNLDIVSGNWNSSDISVLFGNGDGTFQPHLDFAVGGFPYGVSLGDFNLDDKPDVAVAGQLTNNIHILPNDVVVLTCADADGDGYGNPGDSTCPAGPETDCDDGNPAVNPGAIEIGDGIDNDCNGVADEDLQLACQMTPTSLNLQSKGTRLSLQATLTNTRTGEAVDPAPLDPVYFSRVFSNSGVNIILPTPNADPGCDDFTQDGIWETIEDRSIQGSGSITFRFNTPSDGECETMDGNRQDIISVMLDIPNGDIAVLCFSTRYAGSNWPLGCCDTTNVANKGNR
jgi:hypothetical protein